jgi:iron complex transport system permease protein
MSARRLAPWLLLLVSLALAGVAVLVGRFRIAPREVFGALIGDETIPEVVRAVVLRVRAPRAVAAICVGANLAASGTVFQALFHNPLVDARILGVSSGAAFGAAVALAFSAGAMLVQWSSLAFALLAIGLVVAVGWRYGGSTLVLVVTGVLVSALFSSLLGLVKYVADPADALPAITYWLLGSLAGARWSALAPLLVASGVVLPLLTLARWRLNLLTLNSEEAISMGVPIRGLRAAALLGATGLVAVSVSVSGIIGWIGLIVPHIARALVGADHRRVVPAALALGAAAVLALDTVARTAHTAEIPLGVLAGSIGIPGFLVVLRNVLTTRGRAR